MDEKDNDKLNNKKPNTNSSADLFNALLNKNNAKFTQPTSTTAQKTPLNSGSIPPFLSKTEPINATTQTTSPYNTNKNAEPVKPSGFQKSATPNIFNTPPKQPSQVQGINQNATGGVSFGQGGYAGAKQQPTLSSEERQSLLNALNKDLQRTKEIKEEQQAKASSVGGLFSASVNKYGKSKVTVDDIFKNASINKQPQPQPTQPQQGTIFGKPLSPSPLDPTGIERPYPQAQKATNIDNIPKPSALPPQDLIEQLKALKNKNQPVKPDAELNIDERDRSIIEQLKKLQNKQDDEDDEKKKKRKGFLWILFIVLLIGVTIATGILVFYSREWGRDNYEYVRISVSMTNAFDVFYETSTSGERIPRLINPGDSFDLSIVARNSNKIEGDEGAANWFDIFVRFSVWLEIDGQKYPSFIKINPDPNKWQTYDALLEEQYKDQNNNVKVTVNDGFYYYKNVLTPNESVELINKLTFDANNITEIVGGMVAKLVVQIEVLDTFQAILDRSYWRYAPESWIDYMQTNIVNVGIS